MLESELFLPVSKLFESLGYKINAEVMDCDMVATNGDEIIIIELKSSFNLKLVHQIVKRQTITDKVYAAIPRPNMNYYSKRWEEILALLKRLEAGLIVVSEIDGFSYAEVALHPKPYTGRKNTKKREKLSAETEKRTMNFNTGGASRVKLMTAYRENALFIACCLAAKGDLTAKELQKFETGSKTSSILSKNFYGWFARTQEGAYTLTEAGLEALHTYQQLADHYFQKISSI